MLTYGFFNSVNGDRKYNAETISNMFKGLISDGVYKSVGESLFVSESTGLTLKVARGRAVVSERWVENDATINITLSPAHATLNRYTAVVLRRSLEDRNVILTTIDGTPAATPTKPDIVRNDTLYDICLAYIYVGAGVNQITAQNIEDARGNADVCGYVHMLISTCLQRFQNTSIIDEDSTSSMYIPVDVNYEDGDYLDVYVNGFKLSTLDYSIANGMILFVSTLDVGAVVQCINLKSIILGDSDIIPIIDAINGEVV